MKDKDKKPAIVAIDDEIDFITMLKDYFELRGYKIDVASKGVHGIELIHENNPDIVLLDLKMPGVSGKEVLGIVKNKMPHTKVIFISAFNDAGKTKSAMLEAGAYAYINKPIESLKSLEDLINRAYTDNTG